MFGLMVTGVSVHQDRKYMLQSRVAHILVDWEQLKQKELGQGLWREAIDKRLENGVASQALCRNLRLGPWHAVIRHHSAVTLHPLTNLQSP